jgi:hypothetical protein
MPSSRCVVQDCSNTSDKNAGRSLHKSPNDESLRRISVRFVQTKPANFYPSSREIRFMICLDHFSTDCFERLFHLDGLQRRLKPDSVPTIWRKAPAQLLVSYILEHSKRVFIYVSISIPKLSSNRDNWDLNIYIWILPLHVLTWELVMILMWCCIFFAGKAHGT